MAVGKWLMTRGVFFLAEALDSGMRRVLPPKIGNSYVPAAELGEGISAVVYRCTDANGRAVAVKKYLPTYSDGQYRQRLAAEARHLAQSQSPHVVRLLDWGKDDDGCPYLVMELADGCVSDLTRFGSIGIPLAAWIVYQAASGLRAAETIHRDLKPENLLVMEGPGGNRDFQIGTEQGARVVVADWGLCRPDGVVGPTKTQDVLGTPYYMAPEQCRSTRGTDKRTDIYALGIILWELALGYLPFGSDDPFEILDQQMSREPPWPKGQPPELMRILSRCLAKDPEQRYSSFAAFQAELKTLFTTDPIWIYPPDGPSDQPVTGPLPQECRDV